MAGGQVVTLERRSAIDVSSLLQKNKNSLTFHDLLAKYFVIGHCITKYLLLF